MCGEYALFLCITLVELLDTTAGLDVTLTTSEERMALRANINAELVLYGARLERVTATADNSSLMIIRMDTLLHSIHLAFTPRNWELIQDRSAQPWLDLAPHRGKASQILTGNRRHYVHYLPIIAQRSGARNSFLAPSADFLRQSFAFYRLDYGKNFYI